MDEKTKEWLKSLKVGDHVAIRTNSFGSNSYSFSKITKITPKGEIRVDFRDNLLFKDGIAAGSSSKYNTDWCYLEPITEELKARLLYKKKLNQIAEFKRWDKLGEPIIYQVYEIIKDYIEVK